jgi:hypothetical protein
VNRRRGVRLTRRVQVEFWQAGEAVHRGYTTNLSAQGMHIATLHPLPPRSRLRIEVLHGERGFMVEGVVAHRRTVHPELARVVEPGMGVRFLAPAELIAELFPAEERAGAGAAVEAGNANQPPSGDESVEGRIFSVRFASARDFLGIYRRDILNGGLFVATGRPGRLHEVVNVELYPPDAASAAVVVQARVVQRFEPQPGSGAILVGMGVELLDLPSIVERLRPVVDRLEGILGGKASS